MEAKDTNRVAKVILTKGNEVLLLQGASDFYENSWDLPGGHIQEGEDGIVAAARETKEETGLEVKDLEEILDTPQIVYYKARLPGGEIKLSAEHTGYKLANQNAIDEEDISQEFKSAVKQAFS
jgi:8-oxo-dGTP diphosphatase